MISLRTALVGAALLLVPGLGFADGPPGWASDLVLYVSGGPPAGAIEVRLNGQIVAELPDSGEGNQFEVADEIVHGANTLGVRFGPGGRGSGPSTELVVARSRKTSATANLIVDPLVRVALPAEAPTATCEETVRFWAGPPSSPVPELENRYWLVAAGPSIGHRVTAVLNGRPLTSVASGDSYLEITGHVRRGKNELILEATPSCLIPSADKRAALRLTVTRGWESHGDIVFGDPPLCGVDLSAPRSPGPFERKQTFRGR